MQDESNDQHYRTGVILGRVGAIGVALIFGPVPIVLCERLYFGTDYFGESIVRLGVDGFLAPIYEMTGIHYVARRYFP